MKWDGLMGWEIVCGWVFLLNSRYILFNKIWSISLIYKSVMKEKW